MKRQINPVIVIPIYRNFDCWDKSEISSIEKCMKTLSDHPLVFIGPKKVNWEEITNTFLDQYQVRFTYKIFEDLYFENISGYNKLLKSLFFYESFSNFSHLLIYQLDAYVFKDELIYWCKKEHDYIGAPWLEGFSDNSATEFIGVGNGGFSLRNINTALSILPKIERLHKILDFLENKLSNSNSHHLYLYFRFFLLRGICGIKDITSFMRLNQKNAINEDYFWGKLVPSVYKEFKVAPVEDGIKFSFEVNPRLLYNMNDKNLPFGCHAWLKYDPEFWENFLQPSQKGD